MTTLKVKQTVRTELFSIIVDILGDISVSKKMQGKGLVGAFRRLVSTASRNKTCHNLVKLAMGNIKDFDFSYEHVKDHAETLQHSFKMLRMRDRVPSIYDTQINMGVDDTTFYFRDAGIISIQESFVTDSYHTHRAVFFVENIQFHLDRRLDEDGLAFYEISSPCGTFSNLDIYGKDYEVVKTALINFYFKKVL